MEKKVSFKTPDGFRLRGIFSSPAKAHSLAILCHGISSHKAEYLEMFTVLANQLAAKGIASLRFDFRGHGDSSGRSEDFDVIGQIIDLNSAIRWTRDSAAEAAKRLSFVGVSFGGPPGLFWAMTRDPFHRTCLFAPVLSYRRTFLEPETEWAKQSFNAAGFRHALERGYLLLDGKFKVSIKLIEQMQLLDPIAALAGLDERLLLVHGTKDALVPYEVSAGVGSRYPKIKLRIVEGMDHGLFMFGDDDGHTAESKRIFKQELDAIVGHLDER